MVFRGYQFKRALSEVSGTMWVSYTHEPWNVTLPLAIADKVVTSTTPPAAYIIPPQWTHVIDVLAAHDVAMRRTTAAWTGKVERYRCTGMEWQGPPFEGRHPIFAGEGAGAQPGRFGQCTLATEEMTFPAGSIVVPLNQRLSKVAIHWLEPRRRTPPCAGDSSTPSSSSASTAKPMCWKNWRARTWPKTRRSKPNSSAASRPIRASPPAPARVLSSSMTARHGAWPTAWGEYPVGRLLSLDGVPME